MTPEVMLDRMDHCAKSAIPITVRTEPTKSANSDLFTPKIEIRIMNKIEIKVAWITFLTQNSH
jgi:hypothetical protein